MSIIDKLGITHGPWKVHHLGKHWNNPSLEDYEIHWSDDGECICDTVYKKQDAEIIATAPEMLEALIEVYSEYENREQHSNVWFQNAKLIIQKATGKTWEEIKGLI